MSCGAVGAVGEVGGGGEGVGEGVGASRGGKGEESVEEGVFMGEWWWNGSGKVGGRERSSYCDGERDGTEMWWYS